VVVPPDSVLLTGVMEPIVAGVTVALIEVPSASTVPSGLLTDTVRIVKSVRRDRRGTGTDRYGVDRRRIESTLAAAAAAAATCQTNTASSNRNVLLRAFMSNLQACDLRWCTSAWQLPLAANTLGVR
jgi:hypothetical protein